MRGCGNCPSEISLQITVLSFTILARRQCQDNGGYYYNHFDSRLVVSILLESLLHHLQYLRPSYNLVHCIVIDAIHVIRVSGHEHIIYLSMDIPECHTSMTNSVIIMISGKIEAVLEGTLKFFLYCRSHQICLPARPCTCEQLSR
jgi:hypothetical protein